MAACLQELQPFCGLGVLEPYGTFMPALYAVHSACVKPVVDANMQQLQVPRVGVYGDSYDLGSPILMIQTVCASADEEDADTGRARLPAQVANAIRKLTPGSSPADSSPAGAEPPGVPPPRIRVYIIMQSMLQPRECAHFTCSSMDEVSLVPHMALFGGSNLSGPALHATVQMGAFAATGVQETHMSLPSVHDRGLPIGCLGHRAVSVHDSCFSPANAQVRINGTADLVSFISVIHLPASAPGHRSTFFGDEGAPFTLQESNDTPAAAHDQVAVTLHMVPVTEAAEEQCTQWVQKHAADTAQSGLSSGKVPDALPVLTVLFDETAVADAVAAGTLPSGMAEAAAVSREILQI